MSLLLDALKKSEAQRKRGEIPRFETAQMPKQDADGFGLLQRWMLILVFLLVLMMGAAVWWLVPAVRDDAGPATRVAAGGPVEETAGVEMADLETAAAPDGAGGLEQAAAPGAAVAEPTGAGPGSAPRDDVQANPQGEAVAAPLQPPATPRTSSGPEAVRAQSPAQAGRTSTGSAGAAGPDGAAAGSPEIEDALPAPEPEPARPARRSPDPQPEPEPEPVDWIRPWELPEAERARFPELRLSVHFYASRPEDRFVLLNGEQVRQGESIEGVRVAEIRRRGAVVDFGSYRVLIE